MSNNKPIIILIPNAMPLECQAKIMLTAIAKAQTGQTAIDIITNALKDARDNGHKEARNRFWRYSTN